MKVSYHVFKDYKLDRAGESDEAIWQRVRNDGRIRQRRYSFVSMRWHARTRTLYLGATHGPGDLLVAFNARTKKFRSCGYARTPFHLPTENKIHKGLWLDPKEDALYFGTTTLRPISETHDTEGGGLIRYSIATGRFTLVARPTPGDYYQATCYDPARKMMYMYTMPGSCFAAYDTRKKKLVRYTPVESIPHIGCIDDEGGAWGTCEASLQTFFRYLPDRNKFEFPEGCRLPNAREASSIMFTGAGPVDSFINGKDGFLYVGTALAEFYRLNPLTKELKFLGKPFIGRRLAGMYLAEDGMIYLCGGSDKAPLLARYDRKADRFEQLGSVAAPDGTTCYRCHELVVEDGVAYVGETDNPTRSGYLWACEL
jgi:hypothetical protein